MEAVTGHRGHGRGALVGGRQAHVRAIEIEAVVSGGGGGSEVEVGVGGVGLAHAGFPFIEVLPGVSATGGDERAGVVAAVDGPGVPGPSVLLSGMEGHVLLASGLEGGGASRLWR